MGLGIYIKGELKEINSIIDKQVLSERIQKYFIENSHGLFSNFLSFTEDEAALYAVLHPCEEPVEFTWQDTYIICSAKTNSVGPGYHACLVELIEKMGEAIDITWDWGLGEETNDYQDETGYYKNRNFKQLQEEMLQWMKALCKTFSDEGGTQYMIAFPAGYPRMKRDYFAVSPLQMWTKEWFRDVAFLEADQLNKAGSEFFIWWNKQADAEFYRRTGIAVMNIDCPWHFPIDEKETNIFALIDACFEQAKKKDVTIELPEEDWIAVNQFLNEPEADLPETKYGYRKEIMTFDLAGRWSIDLPGHFYYSVEDATEVYDDSVRTVRSQSYSLAEKEKSDEAFAETFFAGEISNGAESLRSETAITGKAIIYYHIDSEAGEEYWILQGVKVTNNQFLLSTICYPTDEDKDWAIQTWNSVRKITEEVIR